MRTEIIHASGRFDRPVRHLADDLHDFATEGADIMALTEQGNMTQQRRTAYRHAGYSWFHADERGADDCAVLWKPTQWQLDGWARSVPITSVVWQRVAKYGGNVTPPTHATVAPLMRRVGAGDRLTVIAVHFPTRSTRLRRRAWASCINGLVKLVKQIRKADPATRIALTADFNADWDNPKDRELLKRAAKRLDLTPAYSVDEPNRGTHGPRAIDGVWTDAEIHSTRVLDDTKASDHRPVEAVINATRKRAGR